MADADPKISTAKVEQIAITPIETVDAPAEKRKHVYVLASHVHAFLENVYDTPEHAGQVLPGWIVGTAGAIQSADPMAYGYLRVEVGPDGVLTPRFRQVTRSSLPAASGPGAAALDTFCFESNTRKEGDEAFKGDCLCGAVPEVTLSH